MYTYTYTHIHTHMHAATVNKEGVNLREQEEIWSKEGLKRRKRKRKLCNYIYNLKQ